MRVSAMREALREVRPKTDQEWMDELIQHSRPEQELAAWEITAFAYTAFFDARTPTPKAKDQPCVCCWIAGQAAVSPLI
jgi:hypothetical protein